MDLLLHGIGELATPKGRSAQGGQGQGEILVLRNAYVVVKAGRIVAVGEGRPPAFSGPVLDCGGRCVTPGLVDPHTHAIFAGNRVAEFLARARGEKYTGGGILNTVAATRAASEEELVQLARPRLRRMLVQGVTTVEIKSGYGLTLADELKILRAIRRLAEELPLTLVPTFMGAHAFPPELPREEYIRLLIAEMIPAVAEEKLAKFCDIFCDRGFYSVEEAREILMVAKKAGFGLKIHADELAHVGAAELAGELFATSAEHLLHVSEEGIRALAQAGTVAVLLPGTAFLLDEPYPPARKLIEAGVPVALGTDFNPGSCPLASLTFVMSLAVLKLKMSPEEVLTAVTINAAASLGLAGEIGSIEPGKKADLVVWDAASFAEIPYWMGQNLAWVVVQNGRIVSAPQGQAG
ncbi:imidazolonepropionase [Candidatus Bipolaricaulota bacterium]|nr:imidazolonepropionase [Candidatus Bipolaricaulota bacterium]